MSGATCKSCGAAIVWAVTSGGKRAPFQLDPAGLLTLRIDGFMYKPVEIRFIARDARYSSHFATCPQASQWRGASR